MADDVIVTSGSYSATVAADEVGGVKYQRAKMVWGADGTVNDADVATGKPLPIQLRLSTGEEVGLPANEAAVAGEPGIVWLAVRKDSLGTIADVVSLSASPVVAATQIPVAKSQPFFRSRCPETPALMGRVSFGTVVWYR